MNSDSITGDICGHITGISLSAFLQLIEMEQKTCTIKVFARNNTGQISFLGGSLIDAETTQLKHLEALYDILLWQTTAIEVEKTVIKTPNQINLPLMHILMESAGRADETGITSAQNINDNSYSAPSKSVLPQVSNNNFCLEIGIKLLIDFDGLSVPFRSTLVGIESGKYLILEAPGSIDNADPDLLKVETLIVKSLYKGTIYAFRSRVTNIVAKPSKLIFIEYPHKIEHHELRKHTRYECNIATQTEVNKNENSGTIKNISKGGCLYSIDTLATKNYNSSELLNDTIPFQCSFPGIDNEINFVGEIRNTKINLNEIGVGIQFNYQDSSDGFQNVVYDYIQTIEYSTENE